MKYIHVFDGLLNEKELFAIHECGKQLITNKEKLNMFYRQGTTEPFDSNKNKEEYDIMFNAYQRLLTEHILNIYKVNTMFGVKHTGFEFHRYEEGDICELHSDGEISSDAILNPEKLVMADIRFATVILYLTDNVGGDLVYPEQNVVISPKRGRVVVAPPYAMFPHYTTPATVRRDIVVTWFAYEKALAVNPGMFKGVYEK